MPEPDAPKPASQTSADGPRHQVWVDVLIGATAFIWLAAALVLALTWNDGKSNLLAMSVLASASVITVVTVILWVASSSRRTAAVQNRESEARHREVVEALAAQAGKVEQLAAHIAALRGELPKAVNEAGWSGYSDALNDLDATPPGVVPFTRGGAGSRPRG